MSGLFEAPDWTGLGLVLLIVGCFLLANGILTRDPRTVVEHRFGGGALPLRSIREMVFQRVQMGLGFAFAIAGCASQLLGHALRSGGTEPAATGGSTALWVGVVVLVVAALEVLGWWWSLFSARRAVRSWLVEHPFDLETDAVLARDVGEVFGIASHGDDTLPSYVARLRRALDLKQPARPRPVQPAPDSSEHLLAPDKES